MKKDYTIREAFIPETEEEMDSMWKMRKRLSKMNPDKFIEFEEFMTEVSYETEEYIDSLREVAGLY